MHGGGHVGGGHVGGGHVGGHGHVGGGHVPGGHGHGGIPAHHHHHQHHNEPANLAGPALGLFSGRGRLRLSDTLMRLHIARAAVLLVVIGVLLWIGLH